MNTLKNLSSILCVVLLFALSGSSLQAQHCFQQDPPMNELGVKIFSVRDAQNISGIQVPGKKIHFSFLNGIHYKRYVRTSALRVSLAYTQYKLKPDVNCTDCILQEGDIKGGYAKIGWEYYGIFDRFEPYGAIDLMGTYGVYLGESEGVDDDGVFKNYTERRSKRSIGFSPAVGFRIFLNSTFSVGAETSFDILYSNTDEMLTETSPGTVSTPKRDSYWQFNYQPLSWLSMNVLF